MSFGTWLRRIWWLPGASLLLLAGATYVGSWRIRTSHNWQPVRTALAWDRKHTVVTEFVADAEARYSVEIDLERELPFEQLQDVLDALHAAKAKPKSKQPGIEVVVSSNGRKVPLDGYRGTYWGETVGSTVAVFQATPGQHFTIQAEVRRAAPELQVLNPHLQVSVYPPDYLPYYMNSALLDLLTLVVGVIGVLALVLAGWRRRSRARPRQLNPAGEPRR